MKNISKKALLALTLGVSLLNVNSLSASTQWQAPKNILAELYPEDGGTKTNLVTSEVSNKNWVAPNNVLAELYPEDGKAAITQIVKNSKDESFNLNANWKVPNNVLTKLYPEG